MQRLRLLPLLLLPLAIVLISSGNVSALSGSQFSAGHIMDDTVFFNSNSMNPTQIQQFMNSKVPTCDTYHTKTSSSNDSGPPYICLKSYTQSTTAKSADSLCGALTAKQSRTSASIIDDVARACGVSQKVLLVLLQKEQGLLTDTWPWAIQYKEATGYGCPDTAPCDSQYFGFFNQVYNAAHQFKRYAASPDEYNYAGDATSYVQWNPNASCGGSNVHMMNQTTAGLYNYTPYQPNAAALNNLYGNGDSCSAYGNRNFWRDYNDWFGTTLASPFFKINNSNSIYILGANNNYYTVPSRDILAMYGYSPESRSITSVGSNYVSGLTSSGSLPQIARFEGSEIDIIDHGKRYAFTSSAMFTNYGYTMGQEAQLPSWVQSYYGAGGNIQSVIKQQGSGARYLMNNGNVQLFTSWAAYQTGSPSYSSQPYVELSSYYLSTKPNGVPILADNQLVYKPDTNSYGFWNGSSLQSISNQTVSEMGLSADCSVSSSLTNMLTSSGSTVGKLAKDSASNLYLIDSKKKYHVQSGDLSALGLSAGSFISVSDNFLAKVATDNMSLAVRENNSQAVYQIKSGQREVFNDRNALNEAGYNLSQVKNLDTSSSSLFPASVKKILSTGTLYRIDSTAPVYLVNSTSSSLLIPSRAMMDEYGFSFGGVFNLSGSQIANYPNAGNLGFFSKDSSAQVWLIQNGNVKHLASSTIYGSSYYNVSPSSIFQLSDSIFSRYANAQALTKLARPGNSAPVYKIENGKKRLFTSWSALVNAGFSNSDITSLSPEYLDTVPNGANIN